MSWFSNKTNQFSDWLKKNNLYSGSNWAVTPKDFIDNPAEAIDKAQRAITGAPSNEQIANRIGKDIADNEAARNALVGAGEQNRGVAERYKEDITDLNQPWIQAGIDALNKLSQQEGFSYDEFMAGTPFKFNQNDPSYQFRMQEALRALDRAAAARGRTLSGAQDRAIARYASNLASQEYANEWQRYMAERQQRLNEWQANQQNAWLGYQSNVNNLNNILNAGAAARGAQQVGLGNYSNALVNANNIIGQANADYYLGNKADRNRWYMYKDDNNRWLRNQMAGYAGAAAGAMGQAAGTGLNMLATATPYLLAL